jgi:protein-L-isoaspartate(D-aspartate) O-methyltransferase
MKKTIRFVFVLLFCSGLILLVSVGNCGRITREETRKIEKRAEGMIQTLKNYGITDSKVLEAMKKVPRHEFIPLAYRDLRTAYGDHPWNIGHGQTISQPYIVAYMTEKMAPQPGEKILEIGTGSGYQAAILAEMNAIVYSIEIIKPLAEHAKSVLDEHGYNVKVKHGDGYKGWPEHAPFDVIIVTCAPENIPQALINQLNIGGRMIIPVGAVHSVQSLIIVRKTSEGIRMENDLAVRFVPMVTGDK